ncbi:hypothetical protein [Streptomyces sp. SP18CM02]|uniref:hypothetical protein n=1 Tax=Streptomyces sp. SP18CM02 TaxID=2758571 RepID=UPI00168B23DA|nr:hypothetical protein [Streptomyces sp. SP18CM02]MBD3550912.1 hypothetical protein [Streptomyces sp. SP18CM02]
MTPKVYEAASVRQLAAVVDGMAGTVSEVRLRQLRMVVGMFDRAVGRDEMPGRASRSAAQLFTWAALGSFWDLAVDGELRARARDVGVRLPLATQGVVLSCLRLLADRVVPGKEVRLPVLPSPAPRATTSPVQEAAMYRFMVDLAGQAPSGWEGQSKEVTRLYRVRLLALAAVVLDTRCRAGELAGMRVQDLGEGLGSVRVVRRQQNGAHLEPVEVRVPLGREARVALGRWLPVRERLVEGLEGARDALWVSVAVSRRGEPPGVPLRAQWIGVSYAREVRWLNAVMAGREGWEPLPVRLEGLRRAWVPPEEVRVREERAAAREAEHPRRPVGRPATGLRGQHGTEYAYNMLGCRCPECTESATNARRARRAARR